jgi:Domain of unknown function (DUF4872)/Butirosin biosynthesis protein H, N-terminal
MTSHQHLKQLVRQRMAKTGERYATARRHILGALTVERPPSGPRGWRRTPFHLPGNVPAATALRIVSAAAGVVDARTGEPYSEAMVFGIAGGIGIGVFSFLYEKEDFASFFIGGRHRWHDDEAYLRAGAERLGLTPTVQESSGVTPAARMLRDCMASGTPCIAFVEAGLLPHRLAPVAMLGGGYHVIVVHGIDEAADTALIGDLADEPLTIPLASLAAARARIRKFKHRLLSVTTGDVAPPLERLVRDGLRACHAGLLGEGAVKSARANFTLPTLQSLADRMGARAGKDSWATVYAPGPRLWNGLSMLYEHVEHGGTGGGLCRPLFAEFLADAASALGAGALAALAEQYARLGVAWSELAHAALPDPVPALRGLRDLLQERAELRATGGETMPADLAALAGRRADLRSEFVRDVPFAQAEWDVLRDALAGRVRALHAAEVEAHAALGAWLGAVVAAGPATSGRVARRARR